MTVWEANCATRRRRASSVIEKGPWKRIEYYADLYKKRSGDSGHAKVCEFLGSNKETTLPEVVDESKTTHSPTGLLGERKH